MPVRVSRQLLQVPEVRRTVGLFVAPSRSPEAVSRPRQAPATSERGLRARGCPLSGTTAQRVLPVNSGHTVVYWTLAFKEWKRY